MRGLFVVLEGIDGSGKTTQVDLIANFLRQKNKYQDVLLTREPTWRNPEIQRHLQEDELGFSNGEKLAHMFVKDRIVHTALSIKPALMQRACVLCDRYSLSTFAYQMAQGVTLEKMIKMNEHAAVMMPDVTFYLTASRELALHRMKLRGELSNMFERDRHFLDELIHAYSTLISLSTTDERLHKLFGRIVVVNGDRTAHEVLHDIVQTLQPMYEQWLAAAPG